LIFVAVLGDMKMTDNNSSTKDFWKKIIYQRGILNESAMFDELHDYGYLLDQVPKVYDTISNGLLSKPNYPAEVIIEQLNHNYYSKATINDDITEMLADISDFDELKQQLREYFEINK